MNPVPPPLPLKSDSAVNSMQDALAIIAQQIDQKFSAASIGFPSAGAEAVSDPNEQVWLDSIKDLTIEQTKRALFAELHRPDSKPHRVVVLHSRLKNLANENFVTHKTITAGSPKQSASYQSGVARMTEKIPGINELVPCPAILRNVQFRGMPMRCSQAAPVHRTIIHLNDRHRWTREEIADWLDTLDVDLTFRSNPQPKKEKVRPWLKQPSPSLKPKPLLQ